jgi:hypothetical protein
MVACADDNIFLRAPEVIPGINDAIWIYECATSAGLKTRKSKAMAVRAWDNTLYIMDISFCTEMRILCLRLKSSFEQSGNNIWAR